MKNNLLLGLSFALTLSFVPAELLAVNGQNHAPVAAQEIAQDDVKGQLVNAFRQTADYATTLANESPQYAQYYAGERNWYIDRANAIQQLAQQQNAIDTFLNIIGSWWGTQTQEFIEISELMQNLINPDNGQINIENAVALRQKFIVFSTNEYWGEDDNGGDLLLSWFYKYLANAFDNISGHAPAAQAAPADGEIEVAQNNNDHLAM